MGRWLLAAAGALLAACASLPAPELPASAWRPVLRSTLVSRAEPGFVWAQLAQGGHRQTVLARREGLAVPMPVAVANEAGEGAEAAVSVQFLPAAAAPALDLLALEQLYALMLRREAQGRYCLAIGLRACDAARQPISHEALLRALAAERQRAATAAGLSFVPVPWRSISMDAAAARAGDAHGDEVAVQVSEQDRPMPGVTVYFNRAPHSGCAAKTGADGVAACRLVDQHGEDGGHEDEEADARVVVTYPGDVRADRVLLPTTFVLPRRER